MNVPLDVADLYSVCNIRIFIANFGIIGVRKAPVSYK